MEQAKHYYIYAGKPYVLKKPIRMRAIFRRLVMVELLKEEGLNNCQFIMNNELWDWRIHVFCGKKKFNKLIEEAHLLGLEDELLIFERKGEKENG